MKTRQLTTSSKRVLIYIMTFLVFGFSLGSLVNFHLNRIYGNPLKTELLFVKKDEKSVDRIIKAQTDHSYDGITPEIAVVPQCSFVYLLPQNIITHYVVNSQHFLTGTGLRAPPLV